MLYKTSMLCYVLSLFDVLVCITHWLYTYTFTYYDTGLVKPALMSWFSTKRLLFQLVFFSSLMPFYLCLVLCFYHLFNIQFVSYSHWNRMTQQSHSNNSMGCSKVLHFLFFIQFLGVTQLTNSYYIHKYSCYSYLFASVTFIVFFL